MIVLVAGLLLALMAPIAVAANEERPMVSIDGELEHEIIVRGKMFATHGTAFDVAKVTLRGHWSVTGAQAQDIGKDALQINRPRIYTQVYPEGELRVEASYEVADIEMIPHVSGLIGPGAVYISTDGEHARATITSIVLAPINDEHKWFGPLFAVDAYRVSVSEAGLGRQATIGFPTGFEDLLAGGFYHPNNDLEIEVYGDYQRIKDGAVLQEEKDLLLGRFRILELAVTFETPKMTRPDAAPPAAEAEDSSATTTEPGNTDARPSDRARGGASLLGVIGIGLATVVAGTVVAVVVKALGGKAAPAAAAQAQPGESPIHDDGSEWVTYPDGAQEWTFPDGTVETHRPDGSAVRRDPDGVVTEHRADGVVVTQHPDGAIDTHYPEGTAVRHYPDGTTVEKTADDVQTVLHPDGSYSRTYPDGRFEYSEGDGYYRTYDADNNLIRGGDCDGEITIDLAPDGAAVITSRYGGSATYRPSEGGVFETITEGKLILNEHGDSISANGDVVRVEVVDGSFVLEHDRAANTISLEWDGDRFWSDQRTGELEVRLSNGLHIHQDAQGRITFDDSESGWKGELSADGREATLTHADGGQIVRNEQSVTIDGVEWTPAGDGAYSTVSREGTLVTRLPDGSATLVNAAGETAVVHADGSVTMTSSDGVVDHYAPDGALTRTLPDGRVERQPPANGGAQ